MPIREFECDKCGVLIELIMKHDDALLDECTECPNGKLKLKFSQTAPVQFKGTGGHNVDYPKKSKK